MDGAQHWSGFKTTKQDAVNANYGDIWHHTRGRSVKDYLIFVAIALGLLAAFAVVTS